MRKSKASKSDVMSQLTREVRKKSGKNVFIHPNALCKFVADTDDKNGNKNLKSTLETKNLDEYLDIVKLSKKQYDVLNEQSVMQNLNTDTNREINQNQFSNVFLQNVLKNSDIKIYETKPLAIPRRPRWKEGINAKDFEKMERESFLNWRRALAQEEEGNMNYAITPFEKNIEVWRQLWLVVEKCHILIQIVDGRNPLYFRCPDLERYIKDVDTKKDNILLVNKADLMSAAVRKNWADYFIENGVKYIFFSALKEAEKIEGIGEVRETSQEEDDEEEEDSDEENVNHGGKNAFSNLLKIEFDEDEKKEEEEKLETIQGEGKEGIKEEATIIEEKTEEVIIRNQPESEAKVTPLEEDITIKVYNREELIELMKNLTKTKTKTEKQNFKNGNHSKKNMVTESFYNIGFIGYPNVGKSSVINVLMMKKRVAVAQMPGKTKHYQTLFLPENKEMCLMDCPGLVFPSFTSSKGDMAVNGITSIDTLREFHTPIAIIIQKIPRKILELYYRISLPDIYSATQFLQILASKRGYITGRSLPDEAKTCKFVLKDYVSGKLLYCNLRPDYNQDKHGIIIPYEESYLKSEDPTGETLINAEEREKMNIMKDIPADFDDDFEKINIDVDTERNLTTQKENFDQLYFGFQMNLEEEGNVNKDKKITKDMKRALKFALKREEITEEEYDEAFTIGDYQEILMKIQKNTQSNKKELVGVKIIEIK